MRGEVIAVDLETTGFDPVRDEILEVAAVRMRDGVIIEEYASLVNPGRPIPPPISQLTGIQDDDVLGSPGVTAVLDGLRSFAGTTPWMAHNSAFDAGFLNRRGALVDNVRMDTLELAAILLPGAPRYTLTALTLMSGFKIGSAHRALFDARATAKVYWMLWEKVLTLPDAILLEMNTRAIGMHWDALPFFEAARQEIRARGIDTPAMTPRAFIPDKRARQSLIAAETPFPVENAQLGAALGETGALAQQLNAYEHRPQQLMMALSVADAFNHSRHRFIEAGTGTGKTFAYLIPAILWAVQNGERVVISTNTIPLQEQLLQKDIPVLREALGIAFTASLLKGRGNYICPRRYDLAREKPAFSADELRVLAKIAVWLRETETGDRGEINFRGAQEQIVWSRISAEDRGCVPDRCKTMMEGACPFYKAKRDAEAAHILIVNHALLISDAASENRVLPPYKYLIIDEGHHFEEAITSGMTLTLDEFSIRRRLTEMASARGLLNTVVDAVREGATDATANRFTAYAADVIDAIAQMDIHVVRVYKALGELAPEGNSDGVRVTKDIRAKTAFLTAQNAWEPLREFFEVVTDALHQLVIAFTKMGDSSIEHHEALLDSMTEAERALVEIFGGFDQFLSHPNDNQIYWLSRGYEKVLAFNTAPLHVGRLMDEALWGAKESVVVTSATLRTGSDFGYIRSRLNGEGIDTLDVGTPFEYQDSTMVFIPNDIPDPSDRVRNQQALERGIISLSAALDGRVMVLFTSYAQLKTTAQAITPRLALGNITVFDQSDGSPRQTLLDTFRNTPRAVLLATRSFWEGVDIPGEALSGLIIAKLPFAVPTDPIFAARSETYADPFNDYTVPDAILRFRQGFGRLIRTATDRGVFVIFDNRVLTKRYGTSFLESLPECNVVTDALETLPQRAASWLTRPKS